MGGGARGGRGQGLLHRAKGQVNIGQIHPARFAHGLGSVEIRQPHVQIRHILGRGGGGLGIGQPLGQGGQGLGIKTAPIRFIQSGGDVDLAETGGQV